MALAVDTCLQADIPSVRLGSIARPAFRDPDLHELRRHDSKEPIWIDATGSVLEFSLAREFASVLARKSWLRW
jgi:hypothetical protein